MDPYTMGMIKENPYVAKTAVEARLAVILRGRNETRGLKLIPQPSRCLRKCDVHEIIICDEENIRPN
jgi:hypothetical protein